jgi:hypothetical protein
MSARTLILVVLFAAACGRNSNDRLTCQNGYTVAAGAKMGCRAPGEPGCASCCVTFPSTCEEFTTSSSQSTTYDSIGNNTCPANCPPCAQCFSQDEATLCSRLADNQSCDCSNTPIPPNPCADAGSCACWCVVTLDLEAKCPAG